MQDAAARESHSRAREELSNPLPVRGRSFSAADVLTTLALLSEPVAEIKSQYAPQYLRRISLPLR
jgi:hypothetical protein